MTGLKNYQVYWFSEPDGWAWNRAGRHRFRALLGARFEEFLVGDEGIRVGKDVHAYGHTVMHQETGRLAMRYRNKANE